LRNLIHYNTRAEAVRFSIDKGSHCVYSINLPNRESTRAMLPRWKQNKPRILPVIAVEQGCTVPGMCYQTPVFTAAIIRPQNPGIVCPKEIMPSVPVFWDYTTQGIVK